MGKGLKDQDGGRTAPPPVTSRHRRIVGNYELGAILAIGDFDSYTQLCTYIPTGVSYVVRIYDKALLAETHWMWERVRESVHVQRALLEHPNLIEMVECFETMTSLYIVMPMFSSITVVKLFVGHFTPSVSGASPMEGARALIPEPKHTCGLEAPAKRPSTNTADGLLRGAKPDFTEDDDYKVYNCYDHSESYSGGNEQNCFAPSLAHKPTEDVGFYDGKKDRQIILGQERDSPLGLTKFCAACTLITRTPPPQPPPLETHWKAGKSSPLLSPITWMSPAPIFHPCSSKDEIAAEGNSGDAMEGPVDFQLVRHVFLGVVHGVLHLHSHGVVHGGIAPDHVLYNPTRGMVKISNMISCYRCRRGSNRTELRGTRHTVAPEVLKQELYDPYLTDAWSLGVLLYFMLNGGRYPHDGANTLKHILHHRIRPMKTGNIPASGVDLVMHLLQPNPSERLTVEAILYHPYCNEGISLTRGSAVGRTDENDECESRKDVDNDSFVSVKTFENGSHPVTGPGNGNTRLQSITRVNNSSKSSHRSLHQLRKQLTQSNLLPSVGRVRSLSCSRNPTTTSNRGPRSPLQSERIAPLPFPTSSDGASPRPLSRRADSLWLQLDAATENEAATIIQRAYRLYRDRRHFRWVTQTLMKKSTRGASYSSINRSEEFGIGGNRSLSSRGRQLKQWNALKQSFPAQTLSHFDDPSGESYLKDSTTVGGSSTVVMLPCHQENAFKIDKDSDLKNRSSDPIPGFLNIEEDDEPVQLSKSNVCATKVHENQQFSPLIQENKLPHFTLNNNFSFPSKAFSNRTPHAGSHLRSKPYNVISPFHTTVARFPGRRCSRSFGGDLQSSILTSQRALRHTVSKPYAHTSYEYKNGVFSHANGI
ncbi:unnamed protein product [Phytomonas sp. Hart1]|nr:unnamed protein product [Phytomonas sp. Hart1]|eukprot:CCW66311.1 unnamed protein product [Phytomonas sp. isolate Hart1]